MGKLKKEIRKAYRKGRKEGFDRGFITAKMIYEDIATDLKLEIEELNTEIIMGIDDEQGGEELH